MKRERNKFLLCKIFGYMAGRQQAGRSGKNLDRLMNQIRERLIALDILTEHDEFIGYGHEEEGFTGFLLGARDAVQC